MTYTYPMVADPVAWTALTTNGYCWYSMIQLPIRKHMEDYIIFIVIH